MKGEEAMKDLCPNCEKIVELEYVNSFETINIKNEKIEIPVNYFKCAECGEEFEKSKSKHNPLDRAYKIYRNRHGMMQPEEIRSLRKKYGLTQREFCKLLGWGEITLSRYENGALQDEAHNTLLNLIKEPDNMLKLLEDRGNFLPEERRDKLIEILDTEIGVASSNISYLEFLGRYKPDILSGYKRLDLYKLFNAIIFFCMDRVLKTKLNKLLFYADFKNFKNYASSITGVRYVHLPYGPVPDNYEHYFFQLRETNQIDLEEEYCGSHPVEKFSARIKPDLSIFTRYELKTLNEVKRHFDGFNASEMRDFSHKEEGYRSTRDKEFISFQYAEKLQI